MHWRRIRLAIRLAGASLLLAATAVAAEPEARNLETLDARLEELIADNARMQEEILRLTREVAALREESAASEPTAEPAAVPTAEPAPSVAAGREALASASIGGAQAKLIDLSLDVLAAVGGSTATNDELVWLQGGNHDPRERGFTFQQAEVSMLGAVDPYVNGEFHLVFFIDQDGESRFELEEAFLQSAALPLGLEAYGLQVEAGQFLTEFGRMNPTHPHAWDWQDQPVVLSRFFGEDGLRGIGARVGWLLPTPWFSELHLGMQNAKGETMTSFLANEEVFEERALGGRPYADPGIHGLDDFLYLVRSTHGFDLSDTISSQLGASVLLGPNATGDDGETQIYGGDFVLKWRPLDAERGWPFVKLEGELMFRRYRADAFTGCFVPDAGCTQIALGHRALHDYGGFVQALWGFRRGLAAGVRYEYASGWGDNVGFDAATDSVVRISRNADPFRSPRHRISPLLVIDPSEFLRLRLQYNYDHQRFLRHDDQHSVWAGVEFLLGSHPAHAY